MNAGTRGDGAGRQPGWQPAFVGAQVVGQALGFHLKGVLADRRIAAGQANGVGVLIDIGETAALQHVAQAA